MQAGEVDARRAQAPQGGPSDGRRLGAGGVAQIQEDRRCQTQTDKYVLTV